MSGRRGGIPGPESRTGLVRPAMSEAEFERLAQAMVLSDKGDEPAPSDPPFAEEPETVPPRPLLSPATGTGSSGRSNRTRSKPAAKPRRVQRMFAIEEDLDKKLWLYAIHLGKDRSEVINDLLRPVVTSMVLYDSRDRRSASRSNAEPANSDAAEGQGGGSS